MPLHDGYNRMEIIKSHATLSTLDKENMPLILFQTKLKKLKDFQEVKKKTFFFLRSNLFLFSRLHWNHTRCTYVLLYVVKSTTIENAGQIISFK